MFFFTLLQQYKHFVFNYDMCQLTAAVSMAGSQSGLWSVEGGNRQVAEHLLKASSANHIKGRVTGVLQLRNSAGSVFYRVQYDVVGESASTLATVDYDMVIVATPVSHGSKYQVTVLPVVNNCKDYCPSNQRLHCIT